MEAGSRSGKGTEGATLGNRPARRMPNSRAISPIEPDVLAGVPDEEDRKQEAAAA
jgi:hypothetical protein